jgi:hypothetical protein
MFWRILWRLLYASRGRLALALIAVISGAAVSAALLNLDLDATDKFTREFRVFGANVVVSAAPTGGGRSRGEQGSGNRYGYVVRRSRADEFIVESRWQLG